MKVVSCINTYLTAFCKGSSSSSTNLRASLFSLSACSTRWWSKERRATFDRIITNLFKEFIRKPTAFPEDVPYNWININSKNFFLRNVIKFLTKLINKIFTKKKKIEKIIIFSFEVFIINHIFMTKCFLGKYFTNFFSYKKNISIIILSFIIYKLFACFFHHLKIYFFMNYEEENCNNHFPF